MFKKYNINESANEEATIKLFPLPRGIEDDIVYRWVTSIEAADTRIFIINQAWISLERIEGRIMFYVFISMRLNPLTIIFQFYLFKQDWI